MCCLMHVYIDVFFCHLGKYWRVPSRKFFAVKRETRTGSDSDSDSDFEQPPPKKSRKRSEPSLSSIISNIQTTCSSMKEDIRLLYAIDRHTKISASLYKSLNSTFSCKICQKSPIVPNVIFARCCKSIIGCQVCVDRWFRGEEGINKPCPLCGTPRALPETMRLHGLDDFLTAIQPLLSYRCDGEQGESSES